MKENALQIGVVIGFFAFTFPSLISLAGVRPGASFVVSLLLALEAAYSLDKSGAKYLLATGFQLAVILYMYIYLVSSERLFSAMIVLVLGYLAGIIAGVIAHIIQRTCFSSEEN